MRHRGRQHAAEDRHHHGLLAHRRRGAECAVVLQQEAFEDEANVVDDADHFEGTPGDQRPAYRVVAGIGITIDERRRELEVDKSTECRARRICSRRFVVVVVGFWFGDEHFRYVGPNEGMVFHQEATL